MERKLYLVKTKSLKLTINDELLFGNYSICSCSSSNALKCSTLVTHPDYERLTVQDRRHLY